MQHPPPRVVGIEVDRQTPHRQHDGGVLANPSIPPAGYETDRWNGDSEEVRLDQPSALSRLCMVVTSFAWELLID